MSTALHTPIAVVGLGCLLPGCEGPEQFWELLSKGEDAIVEMPPERLDRELYYDARRGQKAKTYSTLGGLVPERAPDSANDSYDVAHRLFCDVARQALGSLQGECVGVYVGSSGGSSRTGELAIATMADQIYSLLNRIPDFTTLAPATQSEIRAEAVQRLKAGRPRREENGGPWLEARFGAELVAAELGLNGPNMVIDAACASSLVALAAGALALERGDVDLALVGGCSYAKKDSLLLFSQAQSCSSTGTRPFDDKADGLIGSEGYVALALKTEEKARADGDDVLAVIRGVGLSSDGRGRHLWAPQPEGQIAALRRAYGQVLDPGDTQYIEAHATSTQVGDATEIESLATFFGPYLRGKIPLGSVKSNLGHTLETAGLAAVAKVILAMRHQVIPPTANVKQPNRSINWDELPFLLATEERPWPKPPNGPRRAGVSAFGIGGLNVHVVLEEPGGVLPQPEPRAEVPIAIIGRGVVLPGSHDINQFKALMESGRSALGDAPAERWPDKIGVGDVVPHNRGGFVVNYHYDCLKHRVPPKQVALANPLQFMLLDATDQALAEAGAINRSETSVLVGTQFGGEFGNSLVAGLRFPEILDTLQEVLQARSAPASIATAFEELFFEQYPALSDETGSFTSSTLASRITKAFDFEGGAAAIEAGDGSGLLALGLGSSMLRGGVCDTVVCAGCQHALDLPSFETMARRGAFEDPQFVPGEGVGVVLLKRLADARRDGNPVFGVLVGDATRYVHHDTHAATLLASQRALELSGVRREEVLGVEPGNGPRRAHEAQNQALREQYPGVLSRRPERMKIVGHLGAGEGIVSVILATFQPREGVEAHHNVSETGQASQVLFSGPPPQPRPDQLKTKLRVGAPTLPELVSKLAVSGAGSEAPFTRQDVHRCVLLSSHPADMPSKLQLARTRSDCRSLLEEQGIYLGQAGETPRIAFLFSGQGSQYQGMLRELVAESPAAREQMTEADAILSRLGLPSFAELAWADSGTLDEDPVTTQIAVLIADMIVYAAMTEEGILPDCVAGHSFGEIPAMVAARVLTLEAAIRITLERARALLAASPDGGLLSVQASPEVVRELIAERPIFVTHHNAPEQTVVGGRLCDLEKFAPVLAEHGHKSRALRVPGALHTPLVQAAQISLREALAREKLSPPTRLFYSNVTNDRVYEPEDFCQNLVAQIVQPIAYPALLQRMVDDGVTVFLEIGPNQVLTGLNRQILASGTVISSDHPRRTAREQIERVRAALEVVGGVSIPRLPARTRPVGEVVEFDATLGRKARRRAQPVALPEDQTSPEEPTASAYDPALVRLLIDFVVDLTGYPADVISLDWDLEADLGIDSIKRAQLVGEVSEALALRSGGDAPSLESFRTLRQILDFVQSSGSAAARALAPEADTVREAYARGLDYGHSYCEQIRRHLRERAGRGLGGARVQAPEDLRSALSAEQAAELKGMAEGAGVHIGNLMAQRDQWGEFPGNGSLSRSLATPPTRRYVMRMRVEPARPGFPDLPQLNGPALILGDNPVACQLSTTLANLGATVHVLTANSEAPAQLEELGVIPHLFLTTPFDRGALTELDSRAWQARREHSLLTPFWVCQSWLKSLKAAGRMDDATLVGFTTLGGDFGFTSQMQSFEGGTLTGLLKAVMVESWVAGHRHLPVKIVDARPDDRPETIVAMALKELATPSYEVEVGLNGNLRRIVRPVLRPLDEQAAKKLEGHWVCTGGARGVTAFVAQELGRRYGLTLHLLGRIPRADLPAAWRELWPHRVSDLKMMVMEDARAKGRNTVKAWEHTKKSLEIEQTLVDLEQRGIQAYYHPCNVSQYDDLKRVLDEIRRLGPITGVLHGAGVSRDAKFEHKERERVENCFRAKVDGTLALMELTQKDALKYFVTFGSISGRFGANGHADYSLANDLEAKLVDWYRSKRPEVGAVNIHWHAWGDVGMAVKAEAQLGLRAVDLQFMPASEGLEHLIRELEAGAPEPEVLITDESYFNRQYPEEMDIQAPEEPLRPFLDVANGHEIWLDPQRDHFLTDHRLDDVPLLPLVIGLELVSEAALEPDGKPFRLKNVEVLNGLRFHGQAPRAVRIQVENERITLTADVTSRDGILLEKDRALLRARVDRTPFTSTSLAPRVPKGDWTPVVYQEAARMFHGPALRALRRVLVQDDQLFGQIIAPAAVELAGPDRSTLGWRIPCAALDACLYAAGYLGWVRVRSGQAVPATLGELRFGRLPYPRETCLVHVQFRANEGPGGSFDFALYGSNDDLLLEGLDYHQTWLEVPATV